MEFSNTVGAFINECVNYRYSKEAFELAKLDSEITLINQYNESIEFALENAPYINSGELAFSESFFNPEISKVFTEASVAVSVSNQTDDSIKGKANSAVNTVVGGFLEFIDKIARFFKRIATKLFIKEEQKKVISLINNTTINANDAQAIVELAEKYNSKWNFTVSNIEAPASKNKYKLKPRFAVTDNSSRTRNSLATAYINIGLSDVFKIYPKNNTAFIEIPDYIAALSAISDKPKRAEGNNLNTKLKGMISEVNKNGMLIDINDINDDMFNQIKTISDKAKAGSDANGGLIGFAKTGQLGNYYTQIVTIGGNIMAMITSLVQFRTVIYNKVSEIVKSYNVLNQKKDQGTSETEPEE